MGSKMVLEILTYLINKKSVAVEEENYIIGLVESNIFFLEEHYSLYILMAYIGIEKFNELLILKYKNYCIKRKRQLEYVEKITSKLNNLDLIYIKGPALSYYLYNNSCIRQYKDFDLLINKNAYFDIDRVLKSIGFCHCYLEGQNYNNDDLLLYDGYDIDYMNKEQQFSFEIKTEIRFFQSLTYQCISRNINKFIFLEKEGKTLNSKYMLISLISNVYFSFFTRYGIENKFGLNVLIDLIVFINKDNCVLLELLSELDRFNKKERNIIETTIALLNSIKKTSDCTCKNVIGSYELNKLFYDKDYRRKWFYGYFLYNEEVPNIYITEKNISFFENIDSLYKVRIDKNLCGSKNIKFSINFYEDKAIIALIFKQIDDVVYKFSFLNIEGKKSNINFGCFKKEYLSTYGDISVKWIKTRRIKGECHFITAIDKSIVINSQFLEIYGYCKINGTILSFFNNEKIYKINKEGKI